MTKVVVDERDGGLTHKSDCGDEWLSGCCGGVTEVGGSGVVVALPWCSPISVALPTSLR